MTKLERLKDTMYSMFREEALPELDMEDFIVMWESIMDKWDIKKPDSWELFLDELNQLKSDDYRWFNNLFNIHFVKWSTDPTK